VEGDSNRLDTSKRGRVRDLELFVHDTWRIASKERSSTTRVSTSAPSSRWQRCERGGLDLGAEQAGFHTAAAVEINDDAADTKNFPGLSRPVVRRSIMDVPTKELLRAAGLKGRGWPELLIGGPSCTPFSTASSTWSADCRR